MYRYVTNISDLSHFIIKEYGRNFRSAIDATLGNGHDCDFLSEYFSKVYAFDIQQIAIEKYADKKKENVITICDSHANFNKYTMDNIDCIMYNLGFLPQGDKSITTVCESTLKSIEIALQILEPEGILTIGIYPGHPEGKKEEEEILSFVKILPKNQYAVMLHTFINRENNPPKLLVVEKK